MILEPRDQVDFFPAVVTQSLGGVPDDFQDIPVNSCLLSALLLHLPADSHPLFPPPPTPALTALAETPAAVDLIIPCRTFF